MQTAKNMKTMKHENNLYKYKSNTLKTYIKQKNSI